MKRTLILPIVALAILAFATTDAVTAPCDQLSIELRAANRAVATAEENLKTAQGSDNIEILDSVLGEGRYTGSSYYGVSEAKKALEEAKKALRLAQAAYDSCMSSYTCDSCGEFGDHFVSPQPSCTHMVYSCQSDSGTHTQVVCSRCNQTYWSCSEASNHAQATGKCGHTYWQCDTNAGTHVQIQCENNLRRAEVRNASYERVILYYRRGCGKKFWLCKNFAGHHTITYCSTHPNVGKYGCQSSYACSSAHGSGSGSSSTGTTTSPTVSNNGGSTGGSTGGSDTRVRCGNGSSCSRGGYASSREAHKTTCPAGHRYYGCYRTSWHDRCRAPSSGEVQCGNSGCNRGGVASSRNAHKTTCRRGHTYWSCNPNLSRIHRRH